METKEGTNALALGLFFKFISATCECILCVFFLLLRVGLIGAVHAQVNLGQDGSAPSPRADACWMQESDAGGNPAASNLDQAARLSLGAQVSAQSAL